MSITLNVTVENKGTALAGDEVVQLYLKPLNLSSIWLPRHPRKTLIDFQRVHDVAPGATAGLAFGLTSDSLALATESGDLSVVPGEYLLSVENGAGEVISKRQTIQGERPVVVAGFPTVPPA